ncbi:MAG: acyl-CoA dehydrogenase family protein [Myxococcota bacterium]|nr:acyl-CoA dehydrogenase family protein [Myxococcota bacterium]
MDFSFTEEQEAVRDLGREIFGDHADHERIRESEASVEGIDRELWDALAKANLLGLAVSEAHGGAGMGLSEAALLLTEQGRSVAQAPLLAHIVMAGMPIAEFGSDAQRERYLPRAATGEVILTAALNEYAAVDPARPGVSAKADGEDWLLLGEKICVPAGHLAERILVPARTGDDTIGVFLLDPTTEGVTIERQEVTNHEAQARLVLSGARIDADDVLGDPRDGEAIVRFIEERTAMGLCAIQVGVAEEALRRTAEYTGIRKQFGKALGSFQAVSLRAADAYIDIEAMRSTLWQALWRLEEGLPAGIEVGAAKWWGCRGGQRVVHTAQHLHGGIGSDIDYPIHRFFLWAKQVDLSLGGASAELANLGALVARANAEA